jgi:hypothetical protein
LHRQLKRRRAYEVRAVWTGATKACVEMTVQFGLGQALHDFCKRGGRRQQPTPSFSRLTTRSRTGRTRKIARRAANIDADLKRPAALIGEARRAYPATASACSGEKKHAHDVERDTGRSTPPRSSIKETRTSSGFAHQTSEEFFEM